MPTDPTTTAAPWSVQVHEGDRVFLSIGNYEFEVVVPRLASVDRAALVESTVNLLREKMTEVADHGE